MKSQLARAELNVVGWRHVVSIPTPPAPGEAFSLHFCPNNSYSRNAVRVRNAKGANIGYVSDAPAAYFALLLPEASREVDGGQQWLALKPPKAPPLECALAFSFTFLRRDTYGDYVALLTVSQEPDAQALSAADAQWLQTLSLRYPPLPPPDPTLRGLERSSDNFGQTYISCPPAQSGVDAQAWALSNLPRSFSPSLTEENWERVHWLRCDRRPAGVQLSAYSGKWVIFLSVVDAFWTLAVNAMSLGHLPRVTSAKVAPCGLKSPADEQLKAGCIIFYTADWRNHEDVVECGRQLRELGEYTMSYKTDEFTLAGRYSDGARGKVALYHWPGKEQSPGQRNEEVFKKSMELHKKQNEGATVMPSPAPVAAAEPQTSRLAQEAYIAVLKGNDDIDIDVDEKNHPLAVLGKWAGVSERNMAFWVAHASAAER